MNWSLRARVAVSLSLGLLLLCAASAVFYGRIERFLDIEDAVERAEERIRAANVLLSVLEDAEAASRAYASTGEARFRVLGARRAAVAESLYRRLSDTADPARRRRWTEAGPALHAEVASLSARGRRRGGRAGADARRALRDILAREDVALAQRHALSREDARATIVTMAALIACALLLKIGWAVMIDRGIRQRERAEESLKESEQRLTDLLQAAPDAIVIADADGSIVMVNGQAEAVFGYSQAELVGRAVEVLVPDQLRAAHRGHRAGYARVPSRRLMDVRRDLHARRKDGSAFPADISLSPLRTERGVWSLAIVRDVSDRKAAEEALRSSQERLDMALESAGMGAWELDLRSDRSVRTPRHDQIFGYETMQADWGLDRFMREHVAAEHKPLVDAAFAEARETGSFRLECPIMRRDGAARWILAEGRMMRDASGEPARMVGVVTDVTERREREESLRRTNERLAAANKELETFSYSVSHDLRAPLRAIDGFSNAVLEDNAGKLDAGSVDHLLRVRAASQRMAQLIDDILELSRVSRVEMRREAVDLSAAARGVLDDLRRGEPGRAVQAVVSPGLAAEGDPRLLRLVLQNLLENAWKFTSKTSGARIEFFLSPQEGGAPAFCVQDNGAGFDPAYAGKLFGVFQRLHPGSEYPGTGVGLATCQRIIHRHGGRMWADGALGRGARFYFTV